MAMRTALMLLAFAAVASHSAARAQDDPACAKYQEPLAYNACLASHGPKATDIATSPGPAAGGHAAQGDGEGERPAAEPRRWRGWAIPFSNRGSRRHPRP